ncbi:colicin E5-related ribonuclease [Rheinheimera riviphila]|uniref:colicin E5-related ribonuclease n=1 Tax=Rheinheimera riviphila TaxID=1834037 RepID=UPI0013E35079|nr:colicin E5-related ribonuclease [Rheinheimera riviphila]
MKQFNVGFEITAETTDLMGEQIDLSTGSLSFKQTDIQVPGNFAIPVAVTRITGTADVEYSANRLLGDWSLDLPYIATSMASIDGSTFTGSWAANKACSGPLNPGSELSYSASTLEVKDYWSGDNVYIPGQGSATLLHKDAATPRTTNKNWRIECFTTASGSEGFRVTTQDGTKYTFDKLRLVRGLDIGKAPAGSVFDPTPIDPAPIDPPGLNLPGTLVYYQHYHTFMLATKVEDRFGNWVTYNYVGNRLDTIKASDGREISFGYETIKGDDYVSRATAHGQIWNYSYIDKQTDPKLGKVTRPDGKFWEFKYSPAYNSYNKSSTTYGQCLNYEGIYTHSVTITHPNGAIGTFEKRSTTHGRTEVPRYRLGPVNDKNYDYSFAIDICFNAISLMKKTISGAGLPTMQWHYSYSENIGAFSGEPKFAPGQVTVPANSGIDAGDLKFSTVKAPDGSVTKHYFSRKFTFEDGKELFSDQYDKDGVTLLRRSESKFMQGKRYGSAGDNGLATSNLQIKEYSVLTTESKKTDPIDGYFGSDDSEFLTQFSDFNEYEAPQLIYEASRYSNAANNQSRWTKTTYQHDTTNWLLNMASKQQRSADNSTWTTYEETVYYASSHANKSLPQQKKRFGTLIGTLDYHGDGNLKLFEYNLPNRWVRYDNYKRGKPQQVKLPQRYTASCTANSSCHILLSQTINDTGTVKDVTDLNGHKTSYGYDSLNRLQLIDPLDSAWANTNITYDADVSGLGVLVQNISRGNYRKAITLDGLMRPVLSKEWDSSNEAYTVRYVRQQFNAYGKAEFASVPSINSNEQFGTVTEFDGLQRELSQTNTANGDVTYQYLANNAVAITNGRNYETATEYLAYGSPATELATKVSQPESVATSIVYNLFGLPSQITQGGMTEIRTYNPQMQLCVQKRPETGVKAMQYNNLGEMTRFAEGFAGNAGNCSDYSNVNSSWVTLAYDNQGDVWTTSYADGVTPNMVQQLDNQGNQLSLTAGTTAWAYTYNSAHLLDSETLSIDGKSFVLDPVYNSLGHLSSLVYGGATVQYTPDALGQPTKAVAGSTQYAANVLFYPNGQLKSFSYGNGQQLSLQFSQTLDSQFRPEQRLVTQGNTNKVAQRYAYDPNNNIESIVNLVDSSKSISLTYDGLDRLNTASGYWGSGNFVYDTLGNLTQKNLGTQQLTYQYNQTSKRLDSVTGGYTFSYDDRGNVTNNGKRSFTFNRANQLTNSGTIGYVYDGHNRRVKKTGSNQGYSVYSQNGKLMLTDGTNGATSYIYLGKELIAKVGSAAALEDKPGYTGHVEDKDLSLTYMQQRYYDPVIGRFYSNDPVGFTADKPMMFNRYAYANNNPYRFTDPDGRFAFLAVLVTPQGIALAAATIAAVGHGIKGTQNAMSEESAETDSTEDAGGVVIEDVKQGQVTDRGWTKDEINDLAQGEPAGKTVDNRGPSKTDDGQGRSDTASVYGSKDQHVVINDRTKEVVQVSDKNDSGWKPDSRIEWNEENK